METFGQPPIKTSTTNNHNIFNHQPHFSFKTFSIHRKMICFRSASGFTNRQILILLGEQVSETLSPRSLRKSIFSFDISFKKSFQLMCTLVTCQQQRHTLHTDQPFSFSCLRLVKKKRKRKNRKHSLSLYNRSSGFVLK